MTRASSSAKDVAALTWLSVVLAAQAACVVLLAVILLPLPPSETTVFAEWQGMLRPEKESMVYQIWLAFSLALQAGAVWMYRADIGRGLWMRLRGYVAVETVMAFFIGSALFKMMVYDHQPAPARIALTALIAAAVAVKVFWPEVKRWGCAFWQRCHTLPLETFNRWLYPAGGVLLILIIYLPDPEGVLARIFVGEQFHHWDMYVMNAGWAHLKGQILSADVITRYGLGMPVIMTRLTELLGGFTYLNVLRVLNIWAIVYYVLWYVFMRRWTGSVMMALVSLLVAVRLQMFHTGSYPITFTYPSSTPFRFMFDIVAIWMIWGHIRTHQARYLWMASAVCGLSIYHMESTGLYLTLGLWAYVLFHLVVPSLRGYVWRSRLSTISCTLWIVLPFIVAAALLYTTHEKLIWSAAFWKTHFGFIQYYLSGYGVGAIYSSLRDKLFLQSGMGFVMPLLYVLSLIVVGGRLYFRKIEYSTVMIIFLAVYGLGAYHYYVSLSYWTSYYMIGLPGIFLGMFWLHRFALTLTDTGGRRAVLFLAAFSVYALVTNHNYLSYPNIFHNSGRSLVNPETAPLLPNRRPYFMHLFYEYPEAFKVGRNSLGETEEGFKFETSFADDKALKAYFRDAFNFNTDAELIRRLTSSDKPVALVSSFEARILMQADRKTLFYQAPLINSRPMTLRMFTVSHIRTTDQLQEEIRRIDEGSPEYVFVETVFLTRPVPDAYYYDYPGLMPLVDHIMEHYEPHARGQYLTALKRKP